MRRNEHGRQVFTAFLNGYHREQITMLSRYFRPPPKSLGSGSQNEVLVQIMELASDCLALLYS